MLEVSPASLLVGTVSPGQKVTKQLVVKSKQKFKVTNIDCENEWFNFASQRAIRPRGHRTWCQ